MLFTIGILLGIATATLKGIDTIMNKAIMGNVAAINHSLYRILFVMPVLLAAALFHWHFERVAIIWLLIYGLLEAVNILFHQIAIKNVSSVHVELLSKSKSLMTYIVSLILVTESISIHGIFGMIIFTYAVYLTIDFSLLKDFSKDNKKGFFSELCSVLARTMKPFILYKLVSSGSISNEVLAMISMPIAFVLIWIIFRPKLSLREISVKKYLVQAVVVGISMITSGYAILYAGALLTSMTENFSILVVGGLSYMIYKQRIDKKIWIATLLAIGGIILISL